MNKPWSLIFFEWFRTEVFSELTWRFGYLTGNRDLWFRYINHLEDLYHPERMLRCAQQHWIEHT